MMIKRKKYRNVIKLLAVFFEKINKIKNLLAWLTKVKKIRQFLESAVQEGISLPTRIIKDYWEQLEAKKSWFGTRIDTHINEIELRVQK